MGAGRTKRRKRSREQLRARVAELEDRDAFRRAELDDTDRYLAEVQARFERLKELAAALFGMVAAQHGLLAKPAPVTAEIEHTKGAA